MDIDRMTKNPNPGICIYLFIGGCRLRWGWGEGRGWGQGRDIGKGEEQ